MAKSESSKSKTRIVCISDTHTKHSFSLPPGDILVHTGDFSLTGLESEIVAFLNILKSLTQFRLKIIIAGNHDLTLDTNFYENNWQRWHRFRKEDHKKIGEMIRDPRLATEYGIIYLEDSGFTDPVSGLNFFGSPYQPEFHNWAFNLPCNSPQIAEVWEKIPLDTDVLLTHGPPANILDKTSTGQHAGCPRLLKRLELVKPSLHVFGHIHEGHGTQQIDSTVFVNASICDLRYKPVQPPIVIDLEAKNQHQ